MYVDRFGFEVKEETSLDRVQIRKELVRISLWKNLIEKMSPEKRRPRALKAQVRQGIPDAFRADFYKRICGIESKLIEHKGEFKRLSEQPSRDQDCISKDLHRTFPLHVLFKTREGISSLEHVLVAYSNFDVEIGYVQGMAYLAGMLLTYLTEEQAFWMLLHILQDSTLSFRDIFTCDMKLTRQVLFQFDQLVQAKDPKLFRHLVVMCFGSLLTSY